jgi:hypothetical protein
MAAIVRSVLRLTKRGIFAKMTKRLWMAVVLSLAARAASGSNLFTNGSFETGDFTGWGTFATQNSLIYGVSGINTAPDGPEDGSEYAYFGNGFPIETFINQTITTIPNDLYTITFWVHTNPINNITEAPGPLFPFGTGMQVNFGSHVTSLAISNSTMPWTQFTVTGIATSASTAVQFTAWDDEGGMVFLDNVVGVDSGAVPEPATFPLAASVLVVAGLWRKLKR